MYIYTATTSDAEARRKACRPAGGLEKARLRRCRTSTYRLDRHSVRRLAFGPFPAHREVISLF